jgi:hypothetical protein
MCLLQSLFGFRPWYRTGVRTIESRNGYGCKSGIAFTLTQEGVEVMLAGGEICQPYDYHHGQGHHHDHHAGE